MHDENTATMRRLIVVCAYRVRAGDETAFEGLLDRHTPTLRRLGLITEYPVQVLRRAGGGPSMYLEIFEWVSDDAAARASEVADVIAIWEPMAALCEARDGHEGLEFPLFNLIEQDR